MRYSFESYKPTTKSQERALVIAKKVTEIAIANYGDEQESNPAIVVFSGKPGVGKTHLIESIKTNLDENGINYDSFSGKVVPANQRTLRKIIIGDDAFSRYDKISGQALSGSGLELMDLNEHVLNEWYPRGALVVMSSNFDLANIQTELNVRDTVGRAASRLDEMARRGADVPIIGDDHRAIGEVESLF